MSSSILQKIRNVGRLTHIVNILARYGFKREIQRTELGGLLNQKHDPDPHEHIGRTRAQRLAMAFEELGPTFVKLAQLLSTREDILPKHYVDEFKRLHDNVRPISKELVEKILSHELSKEQYDSIVTFNFIPIGAASIGQVHCAELTDGRHVVFKIQRPEIEQVIHNDISILMGMASLLETTIPELKLLRLTTIIEELKKSLHLELDYLREAATTERMRDFFAGHTDIYIPEIYYDYCTSKVLCMEAVAGTKLTSLGSHSLYRHLVKIGVEAFLDMTFKFGVFHADLHPGNFILKETGMLAIIDFGLTARLPREIRNTMAYMFLAFSKNDVESCAHFFVELTHCQELLHKQELQNEIQDMLESNICLPSKDFQLGRLFMRIAKVTATKQAPLSRELILFFKALIALETFGRTLDSDFQILKLASDYSKENVFVPFDKDWFRHNSTLMARDFEVFARELPMTLRLIGKRLQAGSFSLSVQSDGITNLARELDRASNRLSLTILLGSLVLGSSIATYGKQGQLYEFLATFGLIGFGVAVFLGLWLIIEIIRSGRFK